MLGTLFYALLPLSRSATISIAVVYRQTYSCRILGIYFYLNISVYKFQISLVLYMSHIILSMGILPIVLLKKSSSMVAADTVLRVGRSSRSLPKRSGWSGCAVAIYLLRVSCVWSWRAATAAASTRVLSSVPGVLLLLLLLELLPLSTSVNSKWRVSRMIYEICLELKQFTEILPYSFPFRPWNTVALNFVL